MALKAFARKLKPMAKPAPRVATQPVLTKKEQKELEKRNALVEQYLPYASSIAGKVMQTLSSSVDYDGVTCNARLGLIEAAKKFDPSMNVGFKTFAYYRIKGAVYD